MVHGKLTCMLLKGSITVGGQESVHMAGSSATVFRRFSPGLVHRCLDTSRICSLDLWSCPHITISWILLPDKLKVWQSLILLIVYRMFRMDQSSTMSYSCAFSTLDLSSRQFAALAVVLLGD